MNERGEWFARIRVAVTGEISHAPIFSARQRLSPIPERLSEQTGVGKSNRARETERRSFRIGDGTPERCVVGLLLNRVRASIANSIAAGCPRYSCHEAEDSFAGRSKIHAASKCELYS
jgi:hypothetical protein